MNLIKCFLGDSINNINNRSFLELVRLCTYIDCEILMGALNFLVFQKSNLWSVKWSYRVINLTTIRFVFNRKMQLYDRKSFSRLLTVAQLTRGQ